MDSICHKQHLTISISLSPCVSANNLDNTRKTPENNHLNRGLIWSDFLSVVFVMVFCCAIVLGLHVTYPVRLKGQRVGGHRCLPRGLSVRVRISWFSHDSQCIPPWRKICSACYIGNVRSILTTQVSTCALHCFTRNIKNISKPIWTSTSWHRDCIRKAAKMSIRLTIAQPQKVGEYRDETSSGLSG